METLYVTASEPGAGKTALCAALGRKLQQKGKRVGYLRVARDGDQGNRDALAVRDLLGLDEAASSYYVAHPEPVEVKKAVQEAARGKDILLVEGLGGWLGGDAAAERLDQDIARSLEARILLVLAYSKGLSWGQITESVRKSGVPVLGMVVNKVPEKRMKVVQETVAGMDDGIKTLAILAEDRGLVGLTVAEIAQQLKAEVLSSPEGASEVVENILVNAFTLDPGAVYFGRKGDKAVVSRGERPDFHLAALETSLRCLILSGNTPPIEIVSAKALEKKVPILLAEQDTLGVISVLEAALVEARFQGEKKVQRLMESLERSFDFAGLFQGLGIEAV